MSQTPQSASTVLDSNGLYCLNGHVIIKLFDLQSVTFWYRVPSSLSVLATEPLYECCIMNG